MAMTAAAVVRYSVSKETMQNGLFLVLLAPKKTDNDVEIVKIVNVFKRIWTITILMRKDVPNPGKLVWGLYD